MQLYAQLATSKHRALEEYLDKAKSRSKHWEQKAREGTEKIKGAKDERDKAKEEAQVPRLAAVIAGDAKARVEEAKSKAEAETTRLEVKWTSLLLEIRATKDEVFFLQTQAGKDKEAMEKDYQKALEMIFAYGYGCCAFKHNIYGDHPRVTNGMPYTSVSLPLEFFADPKYPLVLAAIEGTTVEVYLSKEV